MGLPRVIRAVKGAANMPPEKILGKRHATRLLGTRSHPRSSGKKCGAGLLGPFQQATEGLPAVGIGV